MAARFIPLDQSDPAEIAGYALRARLGSGGMGNVYLSFSRGGRPVAIKVVRKEFADDPEFRRRFRQEVTVAQRVQGLYTAPVLDADPDAPIPWLATAYIAGPSLAQAVADYGPFPIFSVCRLLGGVAEGLTSVHSAGLVHRDLKPANVLLAADGPRVIDFGIAHAADASAMTGTGAIIGTPAFMAPEQVSGQAVSPATDVFALAHLVAYAATGRTVFGDGHYAALVYRIANEQPSLDGIPDSLRPVIERCLAKNPAARPGLAEVMEFARQMLSGQTFGLVGASWLPETIAGTLGAYDSAVVPPTAPRASGSLASGPQPGSHPSFPSVPAAVPAVATAAAQGPGYAQGPGSTQAPGTTFQSGTYPGAGFQQPPGVTGPLGSVPAGPGNGGPRKRSVFRKGVMIPLTVVLLAAIGGGAYLGKALSGNAAPSSGTAAGPAVGTSASPTTVASTPTGQPTATTGASASASPTDSSGVSPTASASAGQSVSVSSTTYTTTEPFPLCDANGARWNLVNLTPQTGGCQQNMAAVADPGYSFATVSSFPNNLPLSASNTATVTGQVNYSGIRYCLGPAEGNGTAGYAALLCNNGQWYINSVVGLGSHSPVVGKQLATGAFPFAQSTEYDISLAFASGTGKLSVTFTQGSASPVTQSFSTGPFTPTAVGYALDYDGSAGYSPGPIATLGGFTYTTG